MKDKKFLEGLAHDKRYLEHIVGQLSISATTKNRNPETNSTTRLMLSEVNFPILNIHILLSNVSKGNMT